MNKSHAFTLCSFTRFSLDPVFCTAASQSSSEPADGYKKTLENGREQHRKKGGEWEKEKAKKGSNKSKFSEKSGNELRQEDCR